ncbi:hypothetical protein OIDMADRAFT_15951 [Oidiodendron maius Zn]|uniref:Uncharacterized protein n=1 Tax=Oidiodendron maius (strain Zn) TaxID=913774 RepID=A0A0C3HF99_OIDMZ|nr:hypothetical protein OIDMADRAFT_15951 [Oidiodendron maius Zn]
MSSAGSGTAASFLSLSLTDRVISRSLQSCISKAGTVTPSTRSYFIRYASYTIEFLESRLDATEQSWLPLLSKYDRDLSARAEVYKHLRQSSQRTHETLNLANTSKSEQLGENIPKVLTELWKELEPVFDTDVVLLNKIRAKVSSEDIMKIEEEEKRRRLGMMKTNGHLWCATYLMRSLTPEEREQFPPGVPNMAKSAMLIAGNWQFSR